MGFKTVTMRRELTQLAVDVGVSLLLFIFACGVAGAATKHLTPNIGWLYMLWFAVGMLPFCFYARHRGVFAFDCWDIVAFAPFPIVVGLTQAWGGHPVTLVAACVLMLGVGNAIRRYLPATKSQAN